MKALKHFFATFIILCITPSIIAQCNLSVKFSDTTIQCGNSLEINATGFTAGPTILSSSFNGGSFGPGWSTIPSALFNNPCSPSLDGTPAAWFGNTSSRVMITNAMDLSCGAKVCFDLDFAADDLCGGCSNCEDPDFFDEGVAFSYSIDAGVTWVDIFYFDANSANSGPYYQWGNYCYILPAEASTATTMLKWEQAQVSASVTDHWGIDNVIVTQGDCNYGYDWTHAPGFPNDQNQTVSPNDTTTYYVTYTDGITVCLDSVVVNVRPLEIDILASSNPIDCGSCADLSVDFLNGSNSSIIYDWSTGVLNDVTSPTPIACPIANDLYTVSVLNSVTGCNATDTATLFVNECHCFFTQFDTSNVNQVNGLIDIDGIFEFDYSPTTGTIEVEAINGTGTYSQTFNLPFTNNQVYNYSIVSIPNDGSAITMNIYFSDSLSCSQSFDIEVPENCFFMQFDGQLDYQPNNEVNINGVLEFSSSPESGTLEVEATNSTGVYSQTFNAPFIDSTVYNYSITGIPDDLSPIVLVAYFSDSLACTATFTLTSTVNVEVIDGEENICIFSPNPVNDEAKLVFNNVEKEEVTLTIVNLKGQVIIKTTSVEEFISINANKLKEGMYFFMLKTNNSVKECSGKFAVTH